MLRSPERRESMYKYLPEGMRNLESIEFILNNPDLMSHMVTMFETNPKLMNLGIQKRLKVRWLCKHTGGVAGAGCKGTNRNQPTMYLINYGK